MSVSFSNFRYKLMGALVAAEVLSTFETAMIFAALRYMIEDFGSPAAVGWTITAFLLSAAVSAALFGRLGDIFERRRMLLIVIGLSITGSLVAGFSSTLTGVVIGRIIQGGAGAIFPLCAGILREQVEDRALPIYLGILTAILTVSGGLGLLFGGLLVDFLNWHWIFYTNAAVGVIAWIMIYLFVAPGKPAKVTARTNYVGGLLFVPALVLLLLAVNKSTAWGWGDEKTLALMGAGILILFIWLRSELRADTPLINIRLLGNREILLVIITAALLGITWNQFQQLWSILLQQPSETGVGLGLSASMSGLILQPKTVMALVGGPVAGWFVVRYGTRTSMALGTLVLSGSWFAAMANHDSIPFIFVLMILMGISSTFIYALLPIIIAREAPISRTSEVMGMLTVVRGTATGIGAQILAYLLSVSTVSIKDGGGNFPSPFSYLLTMGYIACGILIVFFCYLFFSQSGARTGQPAEAGNVI